MQTDPVFVVVVATTSHAACIVVIFVLLYELLDLCLCVQLLSVTHLMLIYCEIYISWTFILVHFVSRAIYDFKIPTKFLFTLIILHIISNPQIQVSTNMSNVVKPQNFVPTKLNDFTVFVSCTVINGSCLKLTGIDHFYGLSTF